MVNHSNSHFLSSLQFQMSPSQKASNRAIPWVHSEDRLLLHRVVVGGTPASSKDLHSLSICCTLLSGRRCTWANILMVVMIMMMMVTAKDEIGTGSIGRSCVTMQCNKKWKHTFRNAFLFFYVSLAVFCSDGGQ